MPSHAALIAEEGSELAVAIGNIKAMAFLTTYYAYKIRRAIHLKADDRGKARDSLGVAYGWWMKYSNQMNSMYYGMTMPRTADLPDWHAHDKSVLKEYTDLGGVEAPSRGSRDSE